MGCDIHFRVEYYAPDETVAVEEGKIVVVPEGGGSWRPAERVSRGIDRTIWEKVLATPKEQRDPRFEHVTDNDLRTWIQTTPEFEVTYQDLFYSGRNYGLFWMLTGTRGTYDPTPLPVQLGEVTLEELKQSWGRGRGLPEDVSPEVREHIPDDDVDLHTHSWYTLAELLAADWSEADRYGHGPYMGSSFGDTILAMQAVAIEKCGGDTTKVRAVFAYDN